MLSWKCWRFTMRRELSCHLVWFFLSTPVLQRKFVIAESVMGLCSADSSWSLSSIRKFMGRSVIVRKFTIVKCKMPLCYDTKIWHLQWRTYNNVGSLFSVMMRLCRFQSVNVNALANHWPELSCSLFLLMLFETSTFGQPRHVLSRRPGDFWV